MNRRRGFTFVELIIATAVLVMVLLGGIVGARTATTVAGDCIRSSSADGQAMHGQIRIRQYLLSAGRSTLTATPPGIAVPEPMKDDVPYDNVSFRRTLMSSHQGSVYDPDPADPPITLSFQPRNVVPPEGEIVLTDATGSHVICSGVAQAEFLRHGSRITVRIGAVTRGAKPETCTAVRSLVLRNP